MKIYSLGEKNSVFNSFIAEMRDVHIQKDSMRFRKNMERIGEVFAYEISKTLDYQPHEVQTPLGIATCHLSPDQVVIASILRAGIPLHNGLLNYFDKAQNAFVAAYRKYGKDNKFTIQLEYMAAPDINDKVLILADPMLATGASVLLTYQYLLQKGTPKHCHITSAIASRDGVEYLSRQLPKKGVTLWLGAIDEELTVKSFIVPGLGDAGDLAYGEK
ncbi:MAG: uracil phosphoribosyltransferase [Prevotellaceae bacterium]|nr:uracil phosphoribosyltransferase [Prevotellaceae bacterium]